MIAKRVKRKKGSKSSYARLINYLLCENSLNSEERVMGTKISNCSINDIQLSIKEIESTQSLNQRTKADKTYHLVLSFQQKDKVSINDLYEMENVFAKNIGFEEHQRISVIHGDTNNLHIHIAINKIHPQKLTIHEPYYDKHKLQEVCREMEIKYSLNKNPVQIQKSNMVESYGFKSFESWIKENALDSLLKALKDHNDWNSLQRVAASYDLVFKKSGKGLVIRHKNENLYVKASSIDSNLGFNSLRSKLGPFLSSSETQKTIAKNSYQKTPKSKALKHLWNQYLIERDKLVSARKTEYRALKEAHNNKLKELLNSYNSLIESVMKNRNLNILHRRIECKILKMERKIAIDNLKKSTGAKKKSVKGTHQIPSWSEWKNKQENKRTPAINNSQTLALVKL